MTLKDQIKKYQKLPSSDKPRKKYSEEDKKKFFGEHYKKSGPFGDLKDFKPMKWRSGERPDLTKCFEDLKEYMAKWMEVANGGFSAEGMAELGDMMMKSLSPEAKTRLTDMYKNTIKDIADKGLLPWKARLLEVDESKREEVEQLATSLAEQLNLTVHIQGSEKAVEQSFAELQNIDPTQMEARLQSILTPTSTTQIAHSSAFGFLYELDQEHGDKDQWLVSAATLGKVVDREVSRVSREVASAKDPARVAEVMSSIFQPQYLPDADPNQPAKIVIGLSNKE
jgi:hypothetical protein